MRENIRVEVRSQIADELTADFTVELEKTQKIH